MMKEKASSYGGGVCSRRSEVLDSSSSSRISFFVHTLSHGYIDTVVMWANPKDTVKSIHERIQIMKKIPLFEQTLFYKGKELPWEQTLADCGVENEANLQLSLHNPQYPKAWHVISHMFSIVYRRLCHGEETVNDSLNIIIKDLLDRYVNLRPIPYASPISVSRFFQIFTASSSPSILVALYDSPYPGNKLSADASIRHFLTCCRLKIHNSMHIYCVSLALEFCKLLRRSSQEDPLYLFCRNTLACLFRSASEVVEIEDAEKWFILIQDVHPFFTEVVTSLLTNLDLSMECPSIFGPLINDVADFTSFSIPLEFDQLNLVLNKIDQCLQQMDQTITDQEDKSFYPAFSQYLPILKQLHKNSKLYDGAEEKFWSILTPHRRGLCLLIVRYSKRDDKHLWLLNRRSRSVTNSESRRHLTMLMFPEVEEDYQDLHEIIIDRSHLLTQSFEHIVQADTESLRAGLLVQFKNEEATGPGVLREWFLLVCQAIFNPQNALFVACPNDRRRFSPNPASKVHPLHLDYFSFSGRVIGLALMHRVHVGIVFDRVFFFQLAGKHITLEDIRDADPVLYSSCKQILEMDSDFIDSDALGLTFVREVEELGQRKEVELCPGGKDIVVNSKNRVEYINLLIQDRFVTSISEQVSHFARGFADILSNLELQKFFFQGLEPEDLDWMLCGT